VKRTLLIPDGNGNWQVGEVTEQTVKQDGKNRTTEERISRPDVNGKLSELSRTVGQETETAEGEKAKPSIHILHKRLVRPATAVYN
jgi:hypothetical protein